MAFTVFVAGTQGPEPVRLPFDQESFIAGRATCRFEDTVRALVDQPVGSTASAMMSTKTFTGVARMLQSYARERDVSVSARNRRDGQEQITFITLVKRRPGHFDPLTEED